MLHLTTEHQFQQYTVCIFVVFQNCAATDPNKLNVHLICHTHDDMGFIKTVDQFYFGSMSYFVCQFKDIKLLQHREKKTRESTVFILKFKNVLKLE